MATQAGLPGQGCILPQNKIPKKEELFPEKNISFFNYLRARDPQKNFTILPTVMKRIALTP